MGESGSQERPVPRGGEFQVSTHYVDGKMTFTTRIAWGGPCEGSSCTVFWDPNNGLQLVSRLPRASHTVIPLDGISVPF